MRNNKHKGIVLICLFLLFLFTFSVSVNAASYSGSGDCQSSVIEDSILTGDVGPCSLKHGFITGADHVVLDCQGYAIIGDNDAGFYGIKYNNGVDNFTVKNCEIRNFDIGVYYQDSDDGLISNNTIYNNTGGIKIDKTVETSNNVIIDSNTIVNNTGSPINLIDISYTNITNNHIESNQSSTSAVLLGDTGTPTHNTTLINNTIIVNASSSDGVKIRKGSLETNLINNSIITYQINSHGVSMRDSSDSSSFTNNTITTWGSSSDGLFVLDTSGLTLMGNFIRRYINF